MRKQGFVEFAIIVSLVSKYFYSIHGNVFMSAINVITNIKDWTGIRVTKGNTREKNRNYHTLKELQLCIVDILVTMI